MKWKKFIAYLIFSFMPIFLHAQTVSDLQAQIELKNRQIKQLEQEINQYNAEVNKAGTEAKTLQGSLKALDLTQKKITTDITLTERKINKTTLTITALSEGIASTSKHIDLNKSALILGLQSQNSAENESIIGLILSNKSLGEAWSSLDAAKQVQSVVSVKSRELVDLQRELENKESMLQGQKKSLVSLDTDLNGKKQAVQYTVLEKAALLHQTKDKEQTYRGLLAEKQKQKEQFEKELYDFESQLHIAVDRNLYPPSQHGILSWPLDSVFVTQRFGKTIGAERLYASGSHNGVDFRASIGTPIKSVLSGVVVGAGNTDIYPGCYSFGKWVMVKHENGLSSIYGHLSVISVTQGSQVQTGDIIGYSGATGYVTGPHLHLGLYATQGVRIEQFTQSRGCKQAIIPLADIKAYLDPMAYLPNY